MALEDIITTLDSETRQQVERIINEAKAKAVDIEKEAREIAVQEIEKKLKDSGLEMESERSARITKARNEYCEIVSENRENLTEEAFSEARVQLREFVESKNYPALLEKLFAEGRESLPEAEICRYAKKDERLVKELLKKFGFKGKVLATQMMGGIVFETGDGRIICDNSLESRLERSKKSLREDVGKILFAD